MFSTASLLALANTLILAAGLGAHQVPQHADTLAGGEWLRTYQHVHTSTEFDVNFVPAPHGGGVWLVKESWRGKPIAGSRLAIRVGAGGSLRQVIGRTLPNTISLPASRMAQTVDFELWWPTATGLVPAVVEDQPVRLDDLGPRAERIYRHAETGDELARESLIDEASYPLAGWREDPLTTPYPLLLREVELADNDPVELVDDFVRVVHCEFDQDAEKCVPASFPTIESGSGFPNELPSLDDAQVHTDPEDPWASVAAMNYSNRFYQKLEQWGWDKDVWENVNCGEEGVEPADCRLLLYTNVVTSAGPLDGAYYSHNGTIYMGQATVVDISYDLEVLVHEIGHHVTNGWGRPEPTMPSSDDSFYRTDYWAINEGTSDIYGRWLGLTDEMFVYTRNVGRLYQGPRMRTVGVPFRCPQNVVGESHMEGRIWASAIVDLDRELIAAGLAGEGDVPSLFLPAMAAIRQIPREQEAQFATAAAIVVDEVELSLGAQARALAEDLLAHRGLLACDHVVDLRGEPNFNPPAGAVPARLVEDARFLIFDGHRNSETPEFVANNPRAPAVQHQITLTDDEGVVVVRFVPDRWRSRKRDDEPLDQEGLELAALVRRGAGGITFSVDAETQAVSNDADWWFISQVDSAGDGTVHQIRIDGLNPGETYSIALVSLTAVESGFRVLADHIQWQTLPPVELVDEGESEGGVGTEGSDSDSETQTSGGEQGQEGCGCKQTSQTTQTWGLAVFALPLLWLRRSCRRRTGTH